MARPEITTVLTEFAEFLGQEDKKLQNAIGSLESLTTTQKTSLVLAINELKQSINTLSGNAAGINDSATNETSTLSSKKILELFKSSESRCQK